MTDGDAPPDDASNPAGSGRAHGAAEPRPRVPTAMERVCAHNLEKLRRWAAAHPEPSGRPEPSSPPAPEPERPGARRATAGAPAGPPRGVFRWLPARLVRLYERLAAA